ncbi:MAG: hypothetical protein E6Q76_12330 [Rhizobium sp.]|nr:MAG: hypothetical protein E6Q76_12330 [Rhizobium sp.]
MTISTSALTIFVTSLLALPVEAAGIDCAKSASPSDQMICRDKSLLARDAMLGAIYSAAVRHDEADKIHDRQRRWIATVRSCSDATCVRQAYDDQIGYLLTTKGGRDASADFMSKATDGNEGHLTIFGPVDGLVAVWLASTYVGPGGAEAGDVNADGIDGVVPLTKWHTELSRDACKISLDRLDAKTWRASQTGSCDFADGVVLQGTYRKQ